MTVFLELQNGITGVSFGRTDLSLGGIGTTFHALSHRHGPVGPSFQGMPEKFDFDVFLLVLCLTVLILFFDLDLTFVC